MTTINLRGEKECSPQQLITRIKNHLSAALFQHANHYQTLTHTHAQYLQFCHQKVPLSSNLPTPQQKQVFSSLFHDMETKLIVPVHLLRIVQSKNTLLCLAKQTQHPQFMLLAIVFPSKEKAKLWRQQYSYQTIIQIQEPYRCSHKISSHHHHSLLITRPENIKIESRFALETFTSEILRKEGNSKFRQKKYIEALYDYEFGLGLLHSLDHKRERAILYANSSQCLFEMRLFQSALIYANISISIDRTYHKGVYRQFSCLLQLQELKSVPTSLRAIREICSLEEQQKTQQLYNRYTLHSHGIFDWKDIFTGSNLNFGQYFSQKINTPQVASTHTYFTAASPIDQYELILFSKPMVFKQSQSATFGDNYTPLIQQINICCHLEELFFTKFNTLPSQSILEGHILRFNGKLKGIQDHQTHIKCLRCLEVEKVIYQTAENNKECLGIWQHLFRFKQQCFSNCTYLHIRGGLAIFALRPIKQGEDLTIDFLKWETQKRQSTLQQKFGIVCGCELCRSEWWQFEGSGEVLEGLWRDEEKEWREQGLQKLSLFCLWELINGRKHRERQLMREYLFLLQKYPSWQCIINCLKYMRARSKNDLFDHIKSIIKKLLQLFFRLQHTQAVDLLKALL